MALCLFHSFFVYWHVAVIPYLVQECITIGWCVKYICDLCMTLTFGLNMRIMFTPWILLWRRPSLLFAIGIPNLTQRCIIMRQYVYIYDLCMTLTFDLYVVTGGILSEFYSQFLSCSYWFHKNYFETFSSVEKFRPLTLYRSADVYISPSLLTVWFIFLDNVAEVFLKGVDSACVTSIQGLSRVTGLDWVSLRVHNINSRFE